ncbi:similar to galactosyl transferase GMA12/MNN10 family protein [Plenodomus lingam JN3]|uniref:Similar to galactosyl transferase GMA12/MNN10 family protein n=2 Tax=Leptosphaeria maculans TaxID=5022 RepID=E4ZTY9_LEPMJ|nr:similar to galactosyl transferase GMA12/MNN10 family protein [Plenodomus lingam JN3]CBX94699.1 similar to galactosyl transferase GMA12/MNN10 family protein [Plenodomus lingam JN3]
MRPCAVFNLATEYLGFKIFVTFCILLLSAQLYLIPHSRTDNPNHSTIGTKQSHRVSSFVSHGDTQCLPEISHQLIHDSTTKHVVCRKHSPFTTRRMRIGLATAHFGEQQNHYQNALESHLLHSLIYGTEVHVMCDPIVDDLWNKPAFLLDLLMDEMIKPESKRLEWIMWVDRDTLILDQCRPISSFLPPDLPGLGGRWNRSKDSNKNKRNTTNLLVNNDLNGLNNGVFLLRVCRWAVELFTAILAFRHYNPGVQLTFTEQSAMEIVINRQDFKDQVQFVPQYWFNGYSNGSPQQFKDRKDDDGLREEDVRRGDYLVHFAGVEKKDEVISGWVSVLRELPDIWESRTIQRDISIKIEEFWEQLGY